MSFIGCISLILLVFGLIFLAKPQFSWYLAEGKAYGKYGQKEMPAERRKAHLVRGGVFTLAGLPGLIELIRLIQALLV